MEWIWVGAGGWVGRTVARPRFPINQNAGHNPPTSLFPGSRKETSTTPPEKQNLFQVLTIPPRNSFSNISYFLVKGLKPFHCLRGRWVGGWVRRWRRTRRFE